MIEHNPLTNTEFSKPGLAVGMREVAQTKVVPIKQHYVVGFLFYNDGIQGERVMLIEKRTGPKWMKGLLNGVGGKVEPGEEAWHAMRREYAEEAGVGINTWNFFTKLSGPDWTMDCYSTRATEAQWLGSQSMTEEPLRPISVRALIFDHDVKVVPNVPWMVTMAMHYEKDAYGPYNITVAESHVTGRKFTGSPTAINLPEIDVLRAA